MDTCSSGTLSAETTAYFSWDIRLSEAAVFCPRPGAGADLRGIQHHQSRQLQGSVHRGHLPGLRRNHQERSGRAAAVPGGRALHLLSRPANRTGELALELADRPRGTDHRIIRHFLTFPFPSSSPSRALPLGRLVAHAATLGEGSFSVAAMVATFRGNKTWISQSGMISLPGDFITS
jgi:hypothetical protein